MLCCYQSYINHFFELCRVALIKSRLLNRSTLASTLIGIIPADPEEGDEKYEIGTASVVVQVGLIKMLLKNRLEIQYFWIGVWNKLA